MRELIVTEFVSLDGVMEAPGGEPGHPHSGWTIDYHDDEQMKYKLDETLEAESLLLGRVTYEGFSEAWPPREGAFADKMNAMPKHVVSSTLTDPEWENTTVIDGAVPAEVAKLKEGDGGPILIAGSRTLVHSLIPTGLIDEYRLMIFPVAVGSGGRVWPDSPDKLTLELADTRRYDSGVVVNVYRRPGA
jgi:dihydrofolate reductase